MHVGSAMMQEIRLCSVFEQESGNSEPLANINIVRKMLTTTTLFTEVNNIRGPQQNFMLRNQILMKDTIMASFLPPSGSSSSERAEPSLIPRLFLLRRGNLGIRPNPP